MITFIERTPATRLTYIKASLVYLTFMTAWVYGFANTKESVPGILIFFGLIGAMLVLGARTQGWRGPLTRQMAGWLAFLFVLGLAKNLQGGMVQVDNAAHIGGALGGVIIAATWRRGGSTALGSRTRSCSRASG